METKVCKQNNLSGSNGVSFDYSGGYAYFWSATENYSSTAYGYVLHIVADGKTVGTAKVIINA